MYPNLWNTMKAVLRGNFIALNAYIKTVKESHTSDLIVHPKALEQKEADSPRKSRWQEIIKFRPEIKTETKKTIQRNKELVLWENQHNRQTFIQTNQKTVVEYSY